MKEQGVRMIGPTLLAMTCSQKLWATLKVYLGSKVPRMACLWLMGRAMTSATMKIAPFLPKRSKTMRSRHQKPKSIKKLTETIKRATQKSKIWLFFSQKKKNEPGGTIFKKFRSSKPVSRLYMDSSSKPLFVAQNLLKNQFFWKNEFLAQNSSKNQNFWKKLEFLVQNSSINQKFHKNPAFCPETPENNQSCGQNQTFWRK